MFDRLSSIRIQRMSHPNSSFSPYPSGGLIRTFLKFLRHPTLGHGVDNPPPTKVILTHLFRLYAIEILILIPISFAVGAVSQAVEGADQHALQDLIQQEPLPRVLLLVVLFAPIVEEALFRLPLRYSPLNLAIPAGLLSVPLAGGLLQNLLKQPFVLMIALCFSIVFVVFVVWLCLSRCSQKAMRMHFRRNLRALVFFASIIFGLVHISNYFDSQVWWLAPLLVLPQITLGFLFAYVRLEYGYLWAVFCHGSHNLLALSPVIVMHFASDNLKATMLEEQKELTLSFSDHVLLGVLSVSMLGFLILCLFSAYRSFREWKVGAKVA
jgi:membrane protease YdiL (CAAX protease family)